MFPFFMAAKKTAGAGRPTSSTCELTMYLPVHYQSYGAVADIFMSALRDCQGFGKI